MKIYLVRHGETDWNKERRFQGQVDIPLNCYGIELAEKTAEALREIPFEAVFSSPLCRAVQTAKIMMGERFVPFETDERLKEMNFGSFEGTVIPPGVSERDSNPLYYFWKEPEHYIPPSDGESFEELYHRSAEFMREKIFPLENKYETVLIAGHGALNRSILNSVAGFPIEDFWHIPLLNCAVSELSLENGKLRITEPGKIYY